MNLQENGKEVRKFYELDLEMSMINIFALTWTIVHSIDANSPLNNFKKETLDNSNAEFMVLVKGFNNTLSQVVHSRTSYKYYDVEWNARFSPIFQYKDGTAIVPVNKISNFEKVK